MTGSIAVAAAKGAKPILRRMIFGVLLVNLSVAVWAGVAIRESLVKYQERASVNARNLAQTIEQYIAGTIDKIDYGLFAVAHETERQLQTGGINRSALDIYVAQHQSYNPALEGIRITDSHGEASYGTAPFHGAYPHVGDRDYFLAQKDNAQAGLVISQPYVSRVTGKWSIFFSRRINYPDGSFFGIAYSVISLDSIATLFSGIDMGSFGGISLRDRAMAIIVRYPDQDGSFRGNNKTSPELEELLAKGQVSGTYYSGTTWDGTARTVSYKKIGSYPLYVNVGLAEQDYLTPWHAEAKRFAVMYSAFLIMTLIWMGLLYRNWRDRVIADAMARQTLEQRVMEKTASLREQTEALTRSNADLEQFAYVASHDLREPLRMIGSYVALLERRYADKLDQDGRDFIGFAKEGAVRMDRLVQDLLEFSRIGRRSDPVTVIALVTVVSDVQKSLGHVIAESGATLRIPEILPEVMCHRQEMVSLFQNLVSNAIKFHAPDRTPIVSISVERQDGIWRFGVADNGIGIAPEYYDRIFLIFQRLHTREHYDGTGIGLAVCKKIVEQHGGTMWVESTPATGSIFYFTLSVVAVG